VICNACAGYSGRGTEVRTCRDCLVESELKRKMIDLKTANKFCECFKFGHDKEKLDKSKKKRVESVKVDSV